MISGLSSSGIASAIRTAGQARATMDTMARQIATGQRVSSVKDDGAAWTRASSFNSQKAGLEGRAFIVSALRVTSLVQEASLQTAREAFARIRDIFVAASSHAGGSSARASLKAAFDREIEALTQAVTPSGAITSGFGNWPAGFGVQTTAEDPLLAGEVVFSNSGLGFGPGGSGWTTFVPTTFTGSISAVDVLNGTQAALSEGVRLADHWLNVHIPSHDREMSDDQNWLDRVERQTERDNNLLDTAIGSLTDVDLGAVSTQMRQAEIRQQLANATVRQAISAYGSFATGLLGNVQRTQRGIMA